ncbi:nitrogen permease regulator 2 [Trichomonascus vanleenenianus]|uniref:nitrogen permease regulating protein NPR2 n=1 Tax=Trichomonascus vanleenenianus TaxID=2268995 RepID=UPI003ECB4234
MGIFYSVFDPIKGSKVLSQIPQGAVVPVQGSEEETAAMSAPYFEFDWVKNYVIPKPQLCNRLVTCRVGQYRIVGFPVHIYGHEYVRNSFIFNFAFIFPADAESTVFEMPIRRLAKMFMALEEQNKFLSQTSSLNTISNIIEQIYQDLNNYSECMIPIDDSNTVDMKLFPLFPPPPELKYYHVPISTVQLEKLMDDNWDPTMEKIVPYINGINSIRQIADLADADYKLTCQCIQHLIHYRCIIVVDLFQFSNIYAPTADISLFLTDPMMFRECQAYVYTPPEPKHAGFPSSVNTSSFSSSSSISTTRSAIAAGAPSQTTLFYLYKTLNQGQTVREWYMTNRKLFRGIDVRRFLSFGVIKGLIYRVYCYPIFDSTVEHHHHHHHHHHHQQHHRHQQNQPPRPTARRQSHGRTAGRMDKRTLSHGEADEEQKNIEAVISRIMNVPEHFDSICTDLRLSKEEVEMLLQKRGDWTVVSV